MRVTWWLEDTRLRFVCLFVAVALASCTTVTPSSTLPTTARNVAATRNGTAFKTIYKFGGSDGAKPFSELLNFKGSLYGTTLFGGNSSACGNQGCGTVYKMGRTGAENVIYDFKGNGDGLNPFGSLTKINGTFYGTTQAGGANNDGTVYSVTPSGSERVLYSFKGSPNDGQGPLSGLIVVKGKLYGTTQKGGSAGFGTVFQITKSGKETVLYSFQGQPDGANPRARLIEVNGVLYGTTQYGGNDLLCLYNPNGCGTVFSITTSGQENVLHSFVGQLGSDGAQPQSGLATLGGLLYGTTLTGGVYNEGSVFEITPGGAESLLYSFTGAPDGSAPFGTLNGYNGALYGTTSAGGVASCDTNDNGCGTVFTVSTSGVERVIYSFQTNAQGEAPMSGLTTAKQALFGATSEGGNQCNGLAQGCGTVFRVTP
jgi:uncharacterized repeat protein (TIGR03803 family)